MTTEYLFVYMLSTMMIIAIVVIIYQRGLPKKEQFSSPADDYTLPAKLKRAQNLSLGLCYPNPDRSSEPYTFAEKNKLANYNPKNEAYTNWQFNLRYATEFEIALKLVCKSGNSCRSLSNDITEPAASVKTFKPKFFYFHILADKTCSRFDDQYKDRIRVRSVGQIVSMSGSKAPYAVYAVTPAGTISNTSTPHHELRELGIGFTSFSRASTSPESYLIKVDLGEVFESFGPGWGILIKRQQAEPSTSPITVSHPLHVEQGYHIAKCLSDPFNTFDGGRTRIFKYAFMRDGNDVPFSKHSWCPVQEVYIKI